MITKKGIIQYNTNDYGFSYETICGLTMGEYCKEYNEYSKMWVKCRERQRGIDSLTHKELELYKQGFKLTTGLMKPLSEVENKIRNWKKDDITHVFWMSKGIVMNLSKRISNSL